MTGAEIDAENRRARVSAAAKWRDVSALASARGLAPLSGLSAEVGVVGYTLGGGLGWLSRKHGLACNSVLAAEVITADGKLVRADRSNEPDLFWALRGGGGSFGAVTALEFELYPAEELYAGMFAWPWERTADVLHAWREWISGLPDELSTLARILQLPRLPNVPEPVRGRQLVVIEAAYLGAAGSAGELLRPLQDLARSSIRSRPYRPRLSAGCTWSPRNQYRTPQAARCWTSSLQRRSTQLRKQPDPARAPSDLVRAPPPRGCARPSPRPMRARLPPSTTRS